MKKIKTLAEFYALMNESCDLRRKMVAEYLRVQSINAEHIASLKKMFDQLQAISQCDGKYVLQLDQTKTITLDLSYEINEMRKDLLFATEGIPALLMHMKSEIDNFEQQVETIVFALNQNKCKTFITDRDGTVNNYCGRYASSIQSVYNAVFLTLFAKKCVENAVILTSAPLDKIGLVEISVNPEHVFIYAGSKGREYFNTSNQRRQFPVETSKQALLTTLNERLSTLVQQPQYQKYSLIGSGLQFKFGQTTIARQDISQTIPEDESIAFRAMIEKIVKEIDAENDSFRIEDTGKDIEIILTISGENTNTLKDFDKGDGVEFLDDDCHLAMHQGAAIICGDTSSDVPMISAAQKRSQHVRSVFVTNDEALQSKVKTVDPQALFASTPDVLVTALYKLSQ